MKRKIGKVGRGTLVFNIPTSWVKQTGLKYGDEVEVNEEGSRLSISIEKAREFDETVAITIPKNIPLSRRIVDVYYTLGYNTIKIKFPERVDLNYVSSCCKLMNGFEIVGQGKDYCVLKKVASSLPEETKMIYKRQFNLVAAMGKDLFSALENNDFALLKEVMEMEDLSNRLTIFAKRLLNTQGADNQRETNSKYHVICLLEQITDQYKRIAQVVLYNTIKLNKEIITLLEEIIFFFTLVHNTWEAADIKQVLSFKERSKKIISLAANKKKFNSQEMQISSSLLEISDLILHISAEIIPRSG